MIRSAVSRARVPSGVARALFVGLPLLALAACGGEAEGDAPPPVRHAEVADLRAAAAYRLIGTDDAIAALEADVAALDSAAQSTARPALDDVLAKRARLQTRLDSLDAGQFADAEAFGATEAEVSDTIDGLHRAITRSRVLLADDGRELVGRASTVLSRAESRAARLRADSTAEGLRAGAELDTMRVAVERSLGDLRRRGARFDSLREVVALSVAELSVAMGDTLPPGLRR